MIMAVTLQPPEIRVEVASDASEARLIVPASGDRFGLTAEGCVAELEGAGVEVTGEVRRAVKALIHRAQTSGSGEALEAVVASATPAVSGADGWVEWYVGEAEAEAAPELDPEAEVCHYSRSAFTLVSAAQVIGRVHEPGAGRAGRDVTGQVIEPTAGVAAELELDESITLGPEGELRAQVGGVLVREGQRAAIDPVLRVETDVDFSTGHVEFDGDVIVSGGVRDRFRIRSGGAVTVHGLIEAATIETRGDLHALGGFAGRERGNAHVGGDLHARYLDNISGSVMGDVVCEREVMNCELTVHGHVRAERGAIIGGCLNVTGSVDVGLLGAPAGTLTELIVGRVARLEPLAEGLSRRIAQIQRRAGVLEKARRELQQHANASPASLAELRRRLSGTQAELARLARTREKASAALTRLREAIARERTVVVNVEKRIAPGVVLIVGHQRFPLGRELRGPVAIRCDDEGRVVYQQGHGEVRSLEAVSEMGG